MTTSSTTRWTLPMQCRIEQCTTLRRSRTCPKIITGVIVKQYRINQTLRRSIHLVRRQIRRAPLVAMLLALLLGMWGGTMIYNHLSPATIDPEAYKPLLQTIAKGESNGNYNAHYGST